MARSIKSRPNFSEPLAVNFSRSDPPELPPGITLLERGWLSSNNILITGAGSCALVDSGYATHAAQTLTLMQAALGVRELDVLVNTHLHSDHCGGNAALQARYPALRTLIPPGQASHVAHWDVYALSYQPTGQHCARFNYSASLQVGHSLELGGQAWQVHSAPGHDPNSVLLFEPSSGLLLSADALWENGFGVVFPELDGLNAFEEVAQTLDLIESLKPRIVIPGHGRVFSDVPQALARARKRLDGFVKAPAKHRRYAAKVMIKFKLLAAHSLPWDNFLAWTLSADLLGQLHQADAPGTSFENWLSQLVDELVSSGAAVREKLMIGNALSAHTPTAQVS
jgi:glyoxylase-like metal-dependent hydrolase (beta-lactamase superfamily II)